MMLDMIVIYLVILIAGMGKYASVLSITAGLLYTIPYFGAVVSTITIGLVAYATKGLVTAIVVTIVMIIIHQVIFDTIVAPRVIGGSVNLHPLLTLAALIAGGTLFGIGGTLLAVPVAAAMQVVLVQLYPQLKLDVRSMKKLSKESRTASETKAEDIIQQEQENPGDETHVATAATAPEASLPEPPAVSVETP
jgi:predicted PurR-regulated permease PerM